MRRGPGSREGGRTYILAAFVLGLVAFLSGVQTGYRTMDVDEVVYRNTLREMHNGAGYYPAMRDALIEKEGAPPSQIRSVRPPTMFLLLAYLPERAWRWASAVPIFATIFLAGALARSFDPRAALPATVLTGLWMLGASPFLFLHPEFVGLPLLVGGLWALFTRQGGLAPALLLAATLVRELYLVWFVMCLVLCGRRRAWWVAAGVLVVAAAAHAQFASEILVSHGREPGLNGTIHRLSSFFGGFSPSGSAVGGVIGVITTILGVVALARLAWGGSDRASVLAVLISATMLLILTTFFGRQYWGLTFGPILAIFAPLAVLNGTGGGVTRRLGSPGQT